MLTPEQIEGFRIAAGRLMDPVNTYLLRDIARRIRTAGKLTSTAAYEAWRAEWLGVGRRELEQKLAKLLDTSRRDARKLLRTAARYGYDTTLRRLPGHLLAFEENYQLQQLIASAVAQAGDELRNITQTRAILLVNPYGQYQKLPDAYRECMDYAFQQVFTGAADYNTAIRQACAGIAQHGVSVAYASGAHTSLEAAVRRNMMGGLGLMTEQIGRQNHDDLGCNGWEISAHANSAPDHEPIQGLQYSDAAYEALNNSLVRRIGTLNCGHVASPIILGVSRPQYTPAELEQFRQDNERGVTVDGRHYTGYEATQMQRRLERAIRAQKRRVLLAGPEDADVQKTRLVLLQQEYGRFSKAAGLRTEDERLYVSGFGPKQMPEVRKDVEKYSKVRYHKDGSVVVTDDWTGHEHQRVPAKYMPNAVVDVTSQSGRQRDRIFFDNGGKQVRQVSNGPHGNMKRHPYGKHGEHAHDVIWKNGVIAGRPARELTEFERKENSDILESN